MDSADAEVGENVDTDAETEGSSRCPINVTRDSIRRSSASSPSEGGAPSPPTLVTPPDGGWGWVVVFASFMISLIADGVSLSFGILFVDLVETFGGSKARTSWVGSVFFSMPLLAGPIASYLSDRYGCRKACIAGALLASGAFVVSVFANSLEVLFFTFTLAGLGLALCYVTSVVIVAYYFEKRRSLATGISTCGTGVGTFMFPPLTMYILEEYGLQGTLLILGGFFLNMVVFGALMRDIEPTFPEPKRAIVDVVGEDAAEDSERPYSSLVQLPTYLQEDMPMEVLTEISNKENGYLRSLLHHHPYLLHSFTKKKSPSRDSQGNMRSQPGSKKRTKPKSDPLKPEDKQLHLHRNSSSAKLETGFLNNMRFQRGSITYRGAMLNIRRYRLRASSCPDIFRNSIVTIDEQKSCICFKDLTELLLDMFDMTMFKNIQYTLFCVSNFFLYACIDVPYVYIPDHASTQNMNMESASYLISILGVLNTFGVVMVGYIGDYPKIDSSLLYSSFITISGLMVAIIPWVNDFYGLATVCGIYGFTISANYTLIPIIIVSFISMDNFTGAYGLLLLVQGIGSLVGPPFAGFLVDLTGNYNVTFLCTGLVILFSGIMVAIIPASKWASHKRNVQPTEGSGKALQPKVQSEANGFRNSGDAVIVCFNGDSGTFKTQIQHKSFQPAENADNSVMELLLSTGNNNTKGVVSNGDIPHNF